MINKQIQRKIIVSLIASAVFVINFHYSNNKIDLSIGRKLEVKNSGNTVFSNVDDIMQKINIKPYEVWDRSRIQFPCVPDDSPENQGIFYVKVPKTSSSTLAHVTNRIAAKEAKRQNFQTRVCKTHEPMVHASATKLNSSQRDKDKSFLWTVVRHPNDRAVSHYGMQIMFGQVKPENKQFKEKLLVHGSFKANLQLSFMNTMNSKVSFLEDEEIPAYVQDILDNYNFVGIYERLHESLVVMSMLNGMNINDVVFYYRPTKNARCDSLEEPSWLTDEMKEVLQSSVWTKKQKGDFIMYYALNKKLDMTIDALGREKVQQKVADYDKLVYIGTDLSSRIRNTAGCGVLFPTIYSDMDELKNFDELSHKEKVFVLDTLDKS